MPKVALLEWGRAVMTSSAGICEAMWLVMILCIPALYLILVSGLCSIPCRVRDALANIEPTLIIGDFGIVCGLQNSILGKLEAYNRKPTCFTRFNSVIHTAQAGDYILPYRKHGGILTPGWGPFHSLRKADTRYR